MEKQLVLYNVTSLLGKAKFITLDKFGAGLTYKTNECYSFNEGGYYFTFYIHWKKYQLYFYLQYFRIWLDIKNKDFKFTWLGIK